MPTKNNNSLINRYADDMLKKINDCIDQSLKEVSSLSSAIVHSVNSNGTVNVYLPPDNSNIFSNITNQTPFSLKAGDAVELMLKNGSYNNCWVMAKHKLSQEDLSLLQSQGTLVADNFVTQAELAAQVKKYVDTLVPERGLVAEVVPLGNNEFMLMLI